jgi:hypothetical protein
MKSDTNLMRIVKSAEETLAETIADCHCHVAERDTTISTIPELVFACGSSCLAPSSCVMYNPDKLAFYGNCASYKTFLSQV